MRDYFLLPRPTLFDLCVCLGSVGVAFIKPVLMGFYLEIYTIFLVIIGFNYKDKRHFNGGSLSILGLIGLTCMLLHSFYAVPGNISFQYLNFYLMHEGFGYIFYSCLLFCVVVNKSTNLRLLLIALPIIFKEAWWPLIVHTGAMSPMLAILVGFLVWLLIKKRYRIVGIIVLVGISIVVFNFKWVLMKFECRPHVMMELLRYIRHIPNIGSNVYADVFKSTPLSMLIGSGFNKIFVPDNMLSIKTWGAYWLYRHNDILSLMAYIGVFCLIPIVMFVRELLVRFKGTWFAAMLIAFVVLCSVQITFKDPYKVMIILLSLSWFYVESDR